MKPDQPNSDEGAGLESDLRQRNPDKTTVADQTDANDDQKTEKLTQAGRDIDTDEGAD